MNLQGRNLTYGMTGADVALLQSELRSLGYSITDDEALKSFFGDQTQQQVYQFQQTHNLPPTGEVDQETAARINAAIAERETAAEQAVVYGTVTSRSGAPLVGCKVVAFDRDLRSEQELGTAVTDTAGGYSISYGASQFRRAEKRSADLIVRVYGSDGQVLAASPTLFNAPPRQQVEITIEAPVAEAPSEYERLVAELEPLLEGLSLSALTDDDIAFLAGETGTAALLIRMLSLATQWAKQTGIRPEPYYGMLRQGLPDELHALLAEGAERQRKAVEAAIALHIIPAGLAAEMEALLAALQRALASELAAAPALAAQVLQIALPDPERQTAFIAAWKQHLSGDGDLGRFWESLAQQPGFDAPAVERLRTTLDLGAITRQYPPLVAALEQRRRSGEWSDLRDLARWSIDAWTNLISVVMQPDGYDLPSDLLSKDPQALARSYATAVVDELERRFPTVVLTSRLAADTALELPYKADLLTFLQNQPDLDLRTLHIGSYFAEHGATALRGVNDPQGLATGLAAVQRLLHIAPRYAQMRTLLAAGLHAAHHVVSMSPEQFVARFAQDLGGEGAAATIYAAAEQKAAMALSLFADLRTTFADIAPRVLPGAAAERPELRRLFGSLDYCACDACRSVLSPAAYLVDLLEFLRHRATESGASARDLLLARRPDLGEIELTCENTNTIVPYIDLVNEVLENAVAPVVSAADWQHLPLSPEKHARFQTRRTALELSLYPEHLNAEAYVRLRNSQYPWVLPFDLWGEEVRAYLGQLGLSRADLICAFRPSTAPDDAVAVAIARAALSLSAPLWEIIADTSLTNLRLQWGQPPSGTAADLSPLPIFLAHSGLQYNELMDLLATRFINPALPLRTVDVAPATGCDLDAMRLTGLTDAVLGKLHRFVRLWRALGWSLPDLDRAIRLLGGGLLNRSTLLKLADLARVMQALHLPLAHALSFWAPLDTDGPDSLYAALFWNPLTRSHLADPLFDPARLATSGNPAARISGHTPPVLAALGLTVADLQALLQALAGPGAPPDAPLTLATLSFVTRHVLLSRALHLTVPELLLCKRLTGIDPFDPAQTGATLRLIQAVGAIRSSGFSLQELAYLFVPPTDAGSPLAPTAEQVAHALSELREGLRTAQGEAAIARTTVQSLAESLGVSQELLEPLLTTHLQSTAAAGQRLMADFIAPASSDRSAAAYRLLHRAVLLLSRWRVGSGELPWLLSAAGESDLQLLARVGDPAYRSSVGFARWRELTGLFALRDRFGAAGLTTILGVMQRPSLDEGALWQAVATWSGWRLEDLQKLANRWGWHDAALRTVSPLLGLRDCCDLLSRLGVSAEECWSWTEPTLEPMSRTQRVAESVRQAVKAHYSTEQWATVARPLRDRLREQQAAALTAYLLAHPLPGQTWRTPQDLYDYFLIDVQMSACQDTTRIKLAHSSIQLFVQRALLNLEPGVQADAERDSGWRQWEWMKQYRVWEANRQIFLYPENWIEPSLRDDKSAFFTELESELLQNEMTAETVDTALLGYLEKLDAVARLEICAMYRQAGDRSVLHLFGRTRGTPHLYYYRRQIRTPYATSWTPWEKVEAGIEGDHLIPVVWNDRLYLFWPIFMEQSDPQPIVMPRANEQMAQPRRYSKMQIAWSQYRYAKWTPRVVTKEYARIPADGKVEIRFQAIASDGGDLTLRCTVRSLPEQALRLLGQMAALPDVWRSLLRLVVVPVVKQIDFRFAGSDGSVRRLPMVDTAFDVMPRGTHLEGTSLVEDDWRHAGPRLRLASGLLVPLNAPEGRVDTDQWESTGAATTAVPAGDQLYVFVQESELRTDDSLELSMPVLHTQRILRSLPSAEDGTNRFRLLLSHQQFSQSYELFYQDQTRTFHVELAPDEEVARQIRRALRDATPGSAEYLLLTLLLGLALAGSVRYQFHAHYHPFVRMFMQRVNVEGVGALLQRQVQVAPHELSQPPQRFEFEYAYAPDRRFVHERYPVEEVDFSSQGAYAHYNWELFFHVPFLIATSLSKNQRFADAQRWFHTIFDPTDLSAEDAPARYWRTRPFFEMSDERYQQERIDRLLRQLATGDDDPALSEQVAAWREHPFQPFCVARTRTTAFQRAVVMKYLDNLIAWGDQLFRQESLEAVNEATQLYMLAANILGPRPQRIRPRSQQTAQTYYGLSDHIDAFGNALVQIENAVALPMPMDTDPWRIESPFFDETKKPVKQPAIKLPTDLYFCIAPNERLLHYWDTVADRLFKIRHCLNIEGVARRLPLFDAPIDPALLVQATALGVDVRTALSDSAIALPHYRFVIMLQKAQEFCAEVRSFGAALLATLEKRDAEEMARMRSTHELSLLGQIRQIKEQHVTEAAHTLEALQKSRQAVSARREHYAGLQRISPMEALHMGLISNVLVMQSVAAGLEMAGSALHILPNFKLGAPTSIGATFGGDNLGKALELVSRYLTTQATIVGTGASLVSTLASYQRRAEEWDLQVSLADKELAQLDRQIVAGQVRVEVAQQELRLHDAQARQVRETDTFMRTKYTNRELYDWMSSQLARLYFQSYELAYDMARRAERAYQFERGVTATNLIRFGYWDSLRKGLLAGERLSLDLRRLEAAYLDQNQRDHELTRHLSLALLDSFALHLLRTTGACTINLPEWLFDQDHPGHYMRRIKSVALTLPAVAGPYTAVNCRLTLQSSAVRTSPDLLAGDRYLPDPDMTSDPRFRLDLGSVQSIATSRAHSDAGLFEVNFRDERYLPFEGAGAISTWLIELDPRCNDFDLSTLADVVIELRYTARDGGRRLRERCLAESAEARPAVPRSRLFSARTDLSEPWNAFLYPIDSRPGQTLLLDLDRHRFPFRAQQGEIMVQELHVVLALSAEARRHYPPGGIRVVLRDPAGTVVTPAPAGEGDAGGLTLRMNGDAAVGPVPGAMQRLVPAGTTGRWQLTLPQEVIDGLPDALRAPTAPGRPARLAPEAFEDLLLFVVYEVAPTRAR